MEQAIPLGLVLSELIMNSFKHAFTGRAAGSTSVTFSREDGQVRLRVADDGIGFSPQEMEQGASLGVALIRTLTRQLGGELRFIGGAGTRAELTVPFAGSEGTR